MPFSDDNNLEIPTSGVADWDSPLNGNFNALARGFHFKGVAGEQVNTGNAVCLLGAFVVPYDAASLDAPRPIAVAPTALGSGDEGQFQRDGTIRSLGIWSGNFTVGEAVFTSPASLGILVQSYSGAQHPVGYALAEDAIMLNWTKHLPMELTQVVSFALIVGSTFAFDLDLGHAGYVRKIEVITDSCDAYKLQFWTGSARVGSEELYETVTTSVDGGASDFDVNTLVYTDRSIWNYFNTDTSSPGLIFGSLIVQSASSAGSGNASLTFTVERTS